MFQKREQNNDHNENNDKCQTMRNDASCLGWKVKKKTKEKWKEKFLLMSIKILKKNYDVKNHEEWNKKKGGREKDGSELEIVIINKQQKTKI